MAIFKIEFYYNIDGGKIEQEKNHSKLKKFFLLFFSLRDLNKRQNVILPMMWFKSPIKMEENDKKIE